MFTRLVVPLDGSKLAERALPTAEELSTLTGTPMHLVRVADPAALGPYGSMLLPAEANAFQQILGDEVVAARDYLDRLIARQAGRGRAATGEVRRGTAADEIVASTRSGDLIVMATHGRGGMARWFLGSVAEEVVRRSAVNVLLVRAGSPTNEGEGPVSATWAPQSIASIL